MAAPIFVRSFWRFTRLHSKSVFTNKKHPRMTLQETVMCQQKGWMSYNQRKVEIIPPKQVFLFDTHVVIKKFQDAGYTTEQAEALTEILVDVLSEQVDQQIKNLVSKQNQEIMVQQIMSHIAAIKKDMIILEKSEFSTLKHEYEKQSIELRQLKQTVADELQKVKSGVTLDMSLERARTKEDHAGNKKDLGDLSNKIDIQEKDNEKKLSGLDNKIDKEIANLLATFERYRNDVLKYSGGAVMTCLTICLGFYRLWS